MRYKYETRGIVLSRTPSGEANAFVTLITSEFGLMKARAQGVRRSGAKLAAALATCAESDLVLVRGKEGWRITGAILQENWFARLRHHSSRVRVSRVSGLLVRLVAGEAHEPALFPVMNGFFEALTVFPEDTHEAIEVLAALRVLAALGLDAGEIPGEMSEFSPPVLSVVMEGRSNYIVRINHGISASGL